MLTKFARNEHHLRVSRLASFPLKTIEALILERGIAPEDIQDVKAALVGVAAVISAEDAIRSIFHRADYRPHRYNLTTFPALYTALDHQTCLAEIGYHLGGQVQQGTPVYYQFLEISYDGISLELVGHEEEHPELVSPTNAGYPFCQSIAVQARDQGLDALYAPSARLAGGICVPIFKESAVSNPAIADKIRFVFDGTNLRHEYL